MGKKVSIDKTMQDIVYIKNQIDGLTMLLNNKKNIMAKYFEKSGKSSVSNDELTVYTVEKTKINYDIDKIIATFPKEVTSKFIKSTYTITDWPAFCKLMKKHGIDKPSLRPLISSVKEVKEEPLNYMYEHSEINLNDLMACCEAFTTKSLALRLKSSQPEVKVNANPA